MGKLLGLFDRSTKLCPRKVPIKYTKVLVWYELSSLSHRNLSLVDQFTRGSIYRWINFSNPFLDGNHNHDQMQSTINSLQALISDDPSDAMNPIFQEMLDNISNVMNMNEEQLTIHAANMGLHDNNAL